MTPEERFTKIENAIQALTENQARNESAIRDLIVVSRTVLTSIEQLQTAQKHTDEKLNILIDTVDRIIRNRNGDGGKR
jgi:hypothetical protein